MVVLHLALNSLLFQCPSDAAPARPGRRRRPRGRATRPARGALSVCSIFIASTLARPWPSATSVALGDGQRNHPSMHRRDDLARSFAPARLGAGQRIGERDPDLAAAAKDIGGLADPGDARRGIGGAECAPVGEGRAPAPAANSTATSRSRVSSTRRSKPTRRGPASSKESAKLQGSVGSAAGGGAISACAPARMARGSGGRGSAPRRDRLASMKAVSTAPRANSGAPSRASRKARLVFGPIDLGLGERRPQPGERSFAGRRMGDQLGDHRIVEGRHLVARFDPGVDPQPRPRVELERENSAWARQEAALGILGVEPRFDRPAVAANLAPAAAAAARRRRRGTATRRDRGR